MLSAFRKKLASGLVFLVLGLGLIAIVVTGFGTDGMGGLGGLTGGGGNATLVRVDGEQISENELRKRAEIEFRRAQSQQPTLDMGSFLAGETFEQLLGSMITVAALMEYGGKQGLVVSQLMVDRAIVEIPDFRNFAGQFDENVFRQMLAQQNLTESELRRDIAQTLMRRQLLAPVASGGRTPEHLIGQYSNMMLERRQGTVAIVPAAALAGSIQPSDAEVARYYQANRQRFVQPERRVVQYALFGRAEAAEAARATDAEIQAHYRDNQAQYAAQERRTVQDLVLPTRQQAQQAAEALRSGASFAAVASRFGFAAGDLTYENQTRAEFARTTGEAVAQAAFSAGRGQVAGPIELSGTFHVVRVEAVTGTPARPLEAVRGEIAAAIEQRKSTEALADMIADVEDRIAEGQSVAEIVRARGLELSATPAITADGQAPGQPGWAPSEDLARIIGTAFQIDAEDPEPAVEQIGEEERFALVGIERVEPAATPPLDQIRDRVRAALVHERALERARQLARAAADRVNRGMPVARALAEAGVTGAPPPQPVTLQRYQLNSGGQVPPALVRLFVLPQGRADIVAAPDGSGWFVVHHVERTPGDASDRPDVVAGTRREFDATRGEELAQQFARAVEKRANVRRDEEAIARFRRALAGGR